VCRGAPAVAHETVLDRQLGALGQLALADRGAHDDELERALLAAERLERGQMRIEALTRHVQLGAHGRRC
jgi:hypothetical protein